MRNLWVVLLLAMAGGAFAQGAVLGVTFDPLAPNGLAVGAQADVRVGRFVAGAETFEVAVRGDLSAPVRFDLYPNANLGVSLRVPSELATPYLGTGVGLWWSRIDGEPCWDLTWTLHGGVDVPVTGDLALRLEGQAAPLIGAFRVGVGLSIAVGD